jgi:hypothetical protein
MPRLFQTVLERGAGGDVAVENRAAIVVLAFYATGTGLARSRRKPPSGRKRRGAPSRSPAATTCPSIS